MHALKQPGLETVYTTGEQGTTAGGSTLETGWQETRKQGRRLPPYLRDLPIGVPSQTLRRSLSSSPGAVTGGRHLPWDEAGGETWDCGQVDAVTRVLKSEAGVLDRRT